MSAALGFVPLRECGVWFAVSPIHGWDGVIPKRYARRDANEAQIRDELADCGWLTQPLSMQDWPDLLCAKGARLVLCEIKTEEGTLSDGQIACHQLLALFGVKVIVARSSEEFLRAVGEA